MLSKLVRISGTRHQVGVALGKLARPIMSVYFDRSSTWCALRPWRGHAYLQVLATYIQRETPPLWEELLGMSDGLNMPVDDLLLWNCRGDLLHQTTDGCTSIALYGSDDSRWIAHNQDGDPYLYGRCHIVDVKPDDAPGYVSFYCPGSLPGHTFAANRAGIVQTINNLHTHTRGAGVPRMFLARAVLDCTTLNQVTTLLKDTPRSGAFHHTLGEVNTSELISVEALPGICSIEPIEHRHGHANHLIHAATKGVPQSITDSSRTRQYRAESLLDSWPSEADVETQLVAALHDTEGDLPVLRTSTTDSDKENTLATAVFQIQDHEVKLHIYDRNSTAKQSIDVR